MGEKISPFFFSFLRNVIIIPLNVWGELFELLKVFREGAFPIA